MVDEVFDAPWTRKHDDPRIVLIPQAPQIAYPASLEDVIEVCTAVGPNLKAAGRHWGLSKAAISDHTFIETNDPGEAHPKLDATLTDVIPGCMSEAYLKTMAQYSEKAPWYLIHVEAGKRIFELYSELDATVDPNEGDTLGGKLTQISGREGYPGPWGCDTLGGAGGQTVVGAFSTGTHGGDFRKPPIADAVAALHLVTDGGTHYWIEPSPGELPGLVDEHKLIAHYYKTDRRPEIRIIRDDSLFEACLVSSGRFGVIYSVVIKAVPQYSLYERRELLIWQDIKSKVADSTSDLYIADAGGTGYAFMAGRTGGQQFLQIALCMVPTSNGKKNQVGVSKRWPLALTPHPPGRVERSGDNAGKGPGFSPDPDDPRKGADPSFLETACSNASFLKGIIDGAIGEIKDLIESDGIVVGAGIAAVGAVGGTGLLAIIPQLAAILAILYGILSLFHDDTRMSEVMDTLRGALLDPNNPDPAARAAGVFTWRLIYNQTFEMQQGDNEYEAISYAVMDKHHYGNFCEVNVDSVEVFFDATDSRLIAFVDALIAFEVAQEHQGKSMVGYASLRFTGPTRALIGMERHPITCAVEIACLRDVKGGQELVDYAVGLALDPNFGGILHWGQRNDSTRPDIDRLFGPNASDPRNRIEEWRKALDFFTNGGANGRFSSEFTRSTGLEA